MTTDRIAALELDGVETPYEACPVCGGSHFMPAGRSDCRRHPLWRQGLPQQLIWLRCGACDHEFRSAYFTPRGMELLFTGANDEQIAGGELDAQRLVWADIVRSVAARLPRPPWLDGASIWLDIGCGNGGLVFTAGEFGFHSIGVDVRPAAVDGVRALGYEAVVGDVTSFEVTDPVDVVSMADVLEHIPFPRATLARVFATLRPGGVLLVSCPNTDCASWRAADRGGANPYRAEIEHCHNFSRAGLMRLLLDEGFLPVDYQVSRRYKSGMEITAVRLEQGPDRPD